MVAAGGGGAEWSASMGGNGGGLVGGSSLSAKGVDGPETFPAPCEGPTQTQGTDCPSYSGWISYTGSFGSAGSFPPDQTNYGGLGGGGYYGGSSYTQSFGGSGGSSYISGHSGCNSVKNNPSNIEHTGSPQHYSNIVFTHTKMIEGNSTMPLPDGTTGIWSGTGRFKLTVISTSIHLTCGRNQYKSPFLYFTSILARA